MRSGPARTAPPALPKNPGDVVGACWPFIQAKFPQFIYGFYPEPERWRVNLDLHSCRDPADATADSAACRPRASNAILFFLAFPVVAFFLLRRRRAERLRRELDGRAAVGLQRQHRRRRKKARGGGRDDGRHRAVAVAARQADRAHQHVGWLGAAATDLAARSDPGLRPPGLGRPRGDRRDRVGAGVLAGGGKRAGSRRWSLPSQSLPASAS